MEQLSAVRGVTGTTYIGDGTADEYWCAGEPAKFEVERTDDNEIRIGVQIRDSSSDDATLYLSRSEAIRLLLAVAQAVGDR